MCSSSVSQIDLFMFSIFNDLKLSSLIFKKIFFRAIMDNDSVNDSNSCCNVLLKLKCWLILAKYGASKLELIRQTTQDAALIEFETRLFLRNRFSCCGWDKFTDFTRLVFSKTMAQVTNYLCCPDWSIFYENDNDSVWQLNTIILQEINSTTSSFTSTAHPLCYQMWCNIKQEILSIISSWSESTNTYSNYISACLSATFSQRMRLLVEKYENSPTNTNIQWLYEDITSLRKDRSCTNKDEKHDFWFLSESLNLHFFDESISDYYGYLDEDDVASKLADWLFKESLEEFKANTKRLLCFHDGEQSDFRVLNKQKLSECLDVPVTDLEMYLTSSSPQGVFSDLCLSDGPHYYFDDSLFVELQPVRTSDGCSAAEILNNTADSGLQDSVNTSSIKVELNNVLEDDANRIPENRTYFKEELEENNNPLNSEDGESETVSVPKLQIVGRHQVKKVERSHDTYPIVQHKRRGRPRKIDEYNQTTSRNGQHKYSPENVMDCSTWISDNFFEVPGNKPAIDRARLYELYTNYCLLKLCTPVDRALFGKIIRKVFPELKSRRLIQNQVLKYHYVGLKPKFSELEQALLHTDSSSNPQEILLSYMPVDE